MYLNDFCFDVGLDLLFCGSKIHFSDRTYHTYALKIENRAKFTVTGPVWPRIISQIELGCIPSGSYALGTLKLLWNKRWTEIDRNFSFSKWPRALFALKNPLSRGPKKNRFHFWKLRGILHKSYIFYCFWWRNLGDPADSAFGGGLDLSPQLCRSVS